MNLFQAYQISRSNDFKSRINALMVRLAIERIVGATDGSADMLLGQAILDGKESTETWGLAVCVQPDIMAGDHKEDGSTILDEQIDAQAKILWVSFSK